VGFLADSNITKRALAAALKELMEAKPFSKISVSDICEACDMNRKSFYYHFQDKYDLVNWIYYTECVTALKEKGYHTGWELLDDLCAYFYDNRSFYRKTLTVEGQNSFTEYFRDIVVTIVTADMEEIFGRDDDLPFYVDFYTDALLCAIKRWLLEKDYMPSEEFVRLIKNCLVRTSDSILQEFNTEQARE
jgi:probable dihydroxyacetone kinase regulator